jgi:hypothetical protein
VPRVFSARGATGGRTTKHIILLERIFRQTLDKFGVRAQEQAELKATVESTRPDIVAKPEATALS